MLDYKILLHPDVTQVGRGWLNPTEGGVWTLEESLQVAHLAFHELDTPTLDRANHGINNKDGHKDGASNGEKHQSRRNQSLYVMSMRCLLGHICADIPLHPVAYRHIDIDVDARY